MPMEEFNHVSLTYPTFIKVIRYGLGARGIDRIEREQVIGTKLVGYPLYDAHGNNVATLMKSGSNSYSIGDQRSYDAWGGIRAGNTSGEPNGRYCANLGHLADDESEFVYMRSRYYDLGTGRFLSEDPGRDARNWLTYAKNNPVSLADRSGRNPIALLEELFSLFQTALAMPRTILRLAWFEEMAWRAIFEESSADMQESGAFLADYYADIDAARSLPAGPFQDAAMESALVNLDEAAKHFMDSRLDWAFGTMTMRVMSELLQLDMLWGTG